MIEGCARNYSLERAYPLRYISSMKTKTSVTLSADLIAEIDRLAGPSGNRSAVIERAIRELVAVEARRRRDAHDREILDRHAKRLNREAEDVLSYQVDM